MSSATATVLLLLVLLGKSFAGYSTGFRRTPKPENPEIPPKPIVYPSPHPVKEDPLWVGQGGGASLEKGKPGGDASVKVDSGGKGIFVGGVVGTSDDVEADKVPKEDRPHIGSGHWVPSPDVPPTEEKKVPHDLPVLPHKEDTSVKLDDDNVKDASAKGDGGGKGIFVGGGVGTSDDVEADKVPKEDRPHIGSGHWVPYPDVPPAEEKKVLDDLPVLPHKEDTSVKLDDDNVKEDKVPHPPKEISHPEEKEQPVKLDEDGSIDLPGKPYPDAPETHGGGRVPYDESHKIPAYPDNPLKEDKPDVPNAGAGYDYQGPNEKVPPVIDEEGAVGIIGPLPFPNIPPKDVVVIPPGVKTDTENFNDDEKVPPITDDASHEIPPGSYPYKPPNGDISVVAPNGGIAEDYDGLDGKVPAVIDEEGAVGVGPLPDKEVPSIDTPIIPPAVRTEILEPYPMKVGNGNINLYELMEKLELSRFLHLVEEANLKDLLTGEGPLTIFAPSDYALSKLDANAIRTLATNRELLRHFVLYHLVDGQIYGSSFDERDNSAMVTKFDRAIHVNRYGTTWYVNGIEITARDQICRNGVIHVLDSSLYPFPTGDLLETLEGMENFEIYTELIRNAKLDRELKGNVIYTIFVPTDEAFSKLPPANLEWLKWDIPAIRRMFRQLTVNGMYYTPWIPSGDGKLTSIDEQTRLSLSGYPDAISVNGVRLSQYDITAANGCIHTIDDIWFLSELGTPSSGNGKKDERIG